MKNRRTSLKQGVAGLALAACALLPAAPAAAKEWVVAQIGALQEKPVPEVVQLGEGMRAMFAAVNAQGGIKGQRIDFFQLDDGFSADVFVQKFGEAMKRQPVAILSPFGSPTVQKVLADKLLDTADVVVLNAVPGAESFRNPGHPNLFHIRAGDGQQIERVVQHVRTLGMTRMAVLYVDAPGGVSGFQAATDAARAAAGLALSGHKATLSPESIGAAAAALARSDAQAALVIGPPKFMGDAVAAVRRAGGAQSLFAMSYLVPAELVKTMGPAARGVAIAQAFPNPNGVNSPLQREFRAAMKKAYPALDEYSAFHLEGYLCAKLFVEVARRMKAPSATEFARTLRAMGEVNLGDFRVNFSRGQAGSRFVDIGVMSPTGRLNY